MTVILFLRTINKKACELAARNNLVISPHCEDSQISLDKAKVNSNAAHFPGKPFTHETDFIIREIKMRRAGKRMVAYLACQLEKSSLEVIQQAKERRLARITCEATPHHLLLDENFKNASGSVPKTNPPLRTIEDREALQRGLSNGIIDVIATDHAPHTHDDLKKGASGFVGLENALGVILTKLVHPGILSLKRSGSENVHQPRTDI